MRIYWPTRKPERRASPMVKLLNAATALRERLISEGMTPWEASREVLRRAAEKKDGAGA